MSEIRLEQIPHLDELGHLDRVFHPEDTLKNSRTLREREKLNNKIVPSLEEAIRLSGLKNGMTAELRLFEGGYVAFEGIHDVCVQVPREEFDALTARLAR